MTKEIRKGDLNFLCIREATGTKFHNAEEVWENMQAECMIDRECMWTLHLNEQHEIIEKELVAMGRGNATMTTPREVFRRAIIEGATAVILVHNHPSGDPEPSAADIKLSQLYVNAGNLIGIELLDFFVIASKGYTSFAEKEIGGL
ncbi:MAG: JAB domain-containing protein [Euryarchaeota archaeon]|nr:JAB domain-containing protein [Euryarchaeota archaeon]